MRRFYTIISVIAGNFIYAMSVKLFLLPVGLITGGSNGIALVLEHYWGVPISLFVFIFNMLMLGVGWFVLGRAFAMTTVASSFLYPIFLELLDRGLGNVMLTDDLLLCTIFFGLGVGLGLGLVIRAGASTGGMDIPPLILEKKLRIPVSVSMYCFDFLILVPQMFFRPVENVLYGIILVFIYTIVLDKMLILGKSKTELKIVSPKYEEV